MRGFFMFAKSFIAYSVPKTQQIRLSIRLANQSVNNRFRMCSTLAAVKLNNLFGTFRTSSLEDAEGEFELDQEVSQLITLSLKAERKVRIIKNIV